MKETVLISHVRFRDRQKRGKLRALREKQCKFFSLS
jgi:hypothetical protein